MRNLDFYYLRAKNVLCFGEEGVELYFKDYGSMVQILGENLDDSDNEGKPASNGAGKSTLIELIALGLFGKPVKNPKKLTIDDFLNRKNKSNGEIEIIWDDYRIVRKFKPNGLKIWESKDKIWTDATEVTKGKSKSATEDYIKEKLGLNYETFVNILIFDSKFAFMEADAPARRSIVENLLALEIYANYCDTAKEMQKEIKTELKTLSGKYEVLDNVVKEYQKKLDANKSNDVNWTKTIQSKIDSIELEIKSKQNKLATMDDSQQLETYNKALVEIEEINNKLIPELNNKKEIASNTLDEAKVKLISLKEKNEIKRTEIFKASNYIDQLEQTINKDLKVLEKINNLSEGEKCPTCYSTVTINNYADIVSNSKKSIEVIQLELDKHKQDRQTLKEENVLYESQIKKIEEIIKKIEDGLQNNNRKINEYQKKVTELGKVKKPDLSVEVQLLEQSIIDSKKNLEEKKSELLRGSPYKELIEDCIRCLREKEDELIKTKQDSQEKENKLKYIQYWIKGFGDEGIRRLVVSKIIPTLNSRIAYLLQYLVDNRITLTFDDTLNATIQRNPVDGDPFVYHAMSSGERQKLNLAISQAFAYIMNISTGTCPSFVFFDEIATNVDPNSIIGVYNMLNEISKERQVFVTTHNQNLLNMLQGCETIRVRKKDGISKIVN